MFNKTFFSILCLLFSICISLLYFKKNGEYEAFISQSQQEQIKGILINTKLTKSDKINQLSTLSVDDKIYNNITSNYQKSYLSTMDKYMSTNPPTKPITN